jgi:hypothetical protein
MKIGQLEINLGELTGFIVKAKKNTYAGRGEEKRLPDSSKLLVFQEGNFYYEDNYAGSYQAPGRELVKWQKEDGQRIWQMSYSGGMPSEFWGNKILKDKTFTFLREVLMLINFDYPFRGPLRYENEDFAYTTEVKGNIQKFSGIEWIRSKKLERIIFSQDFIGGLVIPK